MPTIDLGYRARAAFRPFHKRKERWACIVAHRRAGKTVACIADVVDAALRCEKKDPRFAYLAPFYAQAKDVAWGYLKGFALKIPGATANEAELRVDLPNGARIRLYGADNYDRLRGIYLDGVVMDEFADMDPRAWTEVIRPALADRQGWAVFIGTPKGRNAFFEAFERSKSDDEWFSLRLKASETGLVAEAELLALRGELSEDEYDREMECSFDAAIPGAIYGQLMKSARVGVVPWEPSALVTTAWDLGYNDTTAIWFAQHTGGQRRIIDYYEANGAGLDHYAKMLREKPYNYHEHILPHDAGNGELGTGKKRTDTLHELGIFHKAQRVLPATPIPDRINAARLLIPTCHFDEGKCARGIEALKAYQREWDAKNKVFRQNPLHNWASNGADSFGYLAQGWRPVRDFSTRPQQAETGSVFG